MYNVRIFKYPLGWQVRVYDRPVGFCDPGSGKHSPVAFGTAWDEEAGEYVDVEYNPEKQAIEPFGETLATRMQDDEPKDPERSAAVSMSRTRNRLEYLARSNVWDWFLTLTFDPEKVKSDDYSECVKKLKGWLDTVRRGVPDMKYLVVPEMHLSGRFHFHGLFSGCGGMGFRDSGISVDGRKVYNVGRYRLGWSTATEVGDGEKAARYICKYMTKDLCQVSFGRKRYWASRNLDEAGTEEYLVEGADMPSYLAALEGHCRYSKSVRGAEVSVRYFEVDAQPDGGGGGLG